MLVETKENNLLPFRERIGRCIGRGIHSEVRELGPFWVVKIVDPRMRVDTWQKDIVADYEDPLKIYLRSFVPSTYFVVGLNEQNERELFIVQRRIYGKTLKEFSDKELQNNKRALEELNELTMGIGIMYQSEGRVPDVRGGDVLERQSGQCDMKSTENIMVESSGKVWLVDIDMLGPYFSPWSKHMEKMNNEVKSFRHRFGLDVLERQTYEFSNR